VKGQCHVTTSYNLALGVIQPATDICAGKSVGATSIFQECARALQFPGMGVSCGAAPEPLDKLHKHAAVCVKMSIKAAQLILYFVAHP